MGERTPFMVARAAFHHLRTAETAKAYADASLDSDHASPVLAAVAAELAQAGFDDEARRVS